MLGDVWAAAESVHHFEAFEMLEKVELFRNALAAKACQLHLFTAEKAQPLLVFGFESKSTVSFFLVVLVLSCFQGFQEVPHGRQLSPVILETQRGHGRDLTLEPANAEVAIAAARQPKPFWREGSKGKGGPGKQEWYSCTDGFHPNQMPNEIKCQMLNVGHEGTSDHISSPRHRSLRFRSSQVYHG